MTEVQETIVQIDTRIIRAKLQILRRTETKDSPRVDVRIILRRIMEIISIMTVGIAESVASVRIARTVR